MTFNKNKLVTLEILETALLKNNELIFKHIDAREDALALTLKREFDEIDERFNKIDEKFDQKFSEMDKKVSGMDSRIIGIDGRLDYHAETYAKKLDLKSSAFKTKAS